MLNEDIPKADTRLYIVLRAWPGGTSQQLTAAQACSLGS